LRRDSRSGRSTRPGRPEKQERQDRQGKSRMPRFGRAFFIVWTVGGVLYAMAAVALACLPAAYAWQSGGLTVAVAGTGGSLPEDSNTGNSPFVWLIDYLKSRGIRPSREPWKPTGMDYGNTDMQETALARRVYLAWQYNPTSLKAVPPGVNVLAPRWFYVEDDGGVAVVNDLGHLITGKAASWNPVQYVNAAHSAGVEVWAEVFLSTPKLAKQIVTDSTRRNEFISRMAGWVQQYKLDGIDFDFENMDPADAEQYTELIAQCKQALPAGAVICVDVTVPVDKPDPKNWWQCYDREGLGRVADYIAVMTYDKIDMKPTAAIDWVGGKVKAMLGSVPSEKVLMGVPFYGTDFMINAPAGEKLTAVPDVAKSKSSRNIFPSTVKSLLENGFYMSGTKKIAVDYWIDHGTWSDETATMEYSFVDTDGLVHVLYCDDERSLLAKGGLMAFNRLGGVAVWRMEFGNDALWNALSEGMAAAK
jgi:spore germination protein YaaH